jgi:hypothetical protein
MCLSGPIIIFGAVVVVVLCWSCATTVVGVATVVSDEVVGTAVVPLCIFAAGAVLVVELPIFLFAFAVDVVCAVAIDAVTRKALIQKLAANFKYLFITSSPEPGLRLTSPVQYTHPAAPSRYNFCGTTHLQLRSPTCCDTNEVFQSASADLNFMQSG